ncbi:hypothetical protein FBU59_003360 [Linderina macrospora]|uniref:Uncharacterized protein n=1 Tax=Linderina macrospora TaxID=4868 RepID=A0ACC1J8V3_9FUNG|nr:hypothetical protein FBU59_003360 [Linderina macrospora]
MSSYFSIAKDSANKASLVYSGQTQSADSIDSLADPVYKIEYTIDTAVLTTYSSDGEHQLTAAINCDAIPAAAIFDENDKHDAARRIGSMAWKFTNASGQKYKWHITQQGKMWELRQGHANAIATYTNQGPFSRFQGVLAVEPSVGGDFLKLVLISWGLTRKTLDDERAKDDPKLSSSRYPHNHGDWLADGFYSATNRGGLDFAGVATSAGY